MYAGDSFFTLNVPGQIGLAILSTCLGLLTLWLSWRLGKGRPFLLQMLLATLCFAGFIWLAPQIYYTYYIFLLDGLPWQVVIQAPPTPLALFDLLLFAERSNLSFHAQGALGWLLIGQVLFPRVRKQAL